MAKKKFGISVDPETVMYTAISKGKEYSTARMVVKMADNEFMTVSYEWEGDHVPDFAMNLMDFMKANYIETSGVWPTYIDEKKCEGLEAAAQKMCPDCKKPMAKCECEDKENE